VWERKGRLNENAVKGTKFIAFAFFPLFLWSKFKKYNLAYFIIFDMIESSLTPKHSSSSSSTKSKISSNKITHMNKLA